MAAWAIRSMGTGAIPFPEGRWPDYSDESFRFVMGWLADNPGEKEDEIWSYLDWLATYDVQDEVTESESPIKLMTIHAAKGLEWDQVVIAGVNEGILPSKQAIAAGQVEQERRLMYVAMTRAKDKLYLAVRPEESISPSGAIYSNPRSRFLKELRGEKSNE